MENKLKCLKLVVRGLLSVQGHHKCVRGVVRLARAPKSHLVPVTVSTLEGLEGPQIFPTSAAEITVPAKYSTTRISVLKNPILFWIIDPSPLRSIP